MSLKAIDVTKPKDMLQVQGDRVLVHGHPLGPLVLTLVHALEEAEGEAAPCHVLLAINREVKTDRQEWEVTQAWFDRLRPAGKNDVNAQWEITVKPKNNT